MNILVTGSAGFISWHLCRSLLKQGHKLFGIDNFISGQRQNIEDLQKIAGERFNFVEGDVIDLNVSPWAKELPGLHQIYHMACPASPPIYQRDPLHTLDTCYKGTRNVFDLAMKHGAKVLYASTSECYGDPEVHPQPESYRGNVNTYGPRSCYDEGKRVGESLAFAFRERGVKIAIARIFNTYGPRMAASDGRVMTNFVSQAVSNEPLTLYGSGQQTRSFCYVDDLVKGLMALMAANEADPVNLGSSYEYTIDEIASMVLTMTGSKSEKIYVDLPEDDPKVRRPDTTRAESILDWRAEVPPQEGMKFLVEEMQNNS